MGFALGHLPRWRHPSYAASTYCRFRTFTLRIHGYLQATHNWAERGLRGIVVGRKNHYGSRSKRGIEVASLFYSIIETCKLVGAEPKAYLRAAVLSKLRDKVDFILPHQFAAQQAAADLAAAPAQ